MKASPSFWTVALLFLTLIGVVSAARFSRPSNSVTPTPTSAQQPDKKSPIQNFVATIKDARRHLTAAAVARSISIFAMYPVDTIKVGRQADRQAGRLCHEPLMKICVHFVERILVYVRECAFLYSRTGDSFIT
mmetsp:Transcript_13140/g.36299  ORF Transcript_13140/g.36299 Transcript_13140/m.36299 type:complete len:133 (+) Transcript_13140:137-535(+)